MTNNNRESKTSKFREGKAKKLQICKYLLDRENYHALRSITARLGACLQLRGCETGRYEEGEISKVIQQKRRADGNKSKP